jgi:nucleotide-binding universal stress UspA family protein
VYRRISIPLDGTKESEHAVSVAVAIARKSGCPIDLVHVAPPPLYSTELFGAAALGYVLLAVSFTLLLIY